jgi:hypothetical protein
MEFKCLRKIRGGLREDERRFVEVFEWWKSLERIVYGLDAAENLKEILSI